MDNEDINPDANRRRYEAPYTQKHRIPNIQEYREQRKGIQEEEQAQNRQDDVEVESDNADKGRGRRTTDAVKGIFGLDKQEHLPGKVYDTENRHQPTNNRNPSDINHGEEETHSYDDPPPVPDKDRPNSSQTKGKNGEGQSASEAAASLHDPRAKRKAMKHNKRQEGGREVTDPVTHLPIVIHDVTKRDLMRAPENEPAVGTEPSTSTGVDGANKSQSQLDVEVDEGQEGIRGMEQLYPPPDFEDTQTSLIKVYRFALVLGLSILLVLMMLFMVGWQLLVIRSRAQLQKGTDSERGTRVFVPIFLTIVLSTVSGGALVWAIQGWLIKKVEHIWQDKVWGAARKHEQEQNSSSSALPESTQWLNMLLASIWPLINPDLFTSLGDTLEDTMQASLPRMVRMVSVDDLGQGSESLRILGIRWLPTGAAARSVGQDGKLESPDSQECSDRVDPGQGQIERYDDDDDENRDGKNEQKDNHPSNENKATEQDQENIAAGMEAEQGDFINVEVAFAYRATATSRSLKAKANNAHLLIRFFLPGSIALPVWVEMRGIVGTMRLRLQLTPDPPFFALATMTFLGQPKADLSCVPLSRHNLNVMDLPLISTFVQSSIDAALAEYVAPKSLTLDLKQMLAGDDFKKDTLSRGIVAVRIKRAYDFKEGDNSLGPLKDGSADPYCTVSWAKFGKPMFSTRIIFSEMEPWWDEWAYVLVGPEELNAEEILRIQLWDSDRSTADDDLGRVELGLKELMSKEETNGRIMDRTDRLKGEKQGELMPGSLEWGVGYFAKTRITPEQLANQSAEPDIRSVDDLKKDVSKKAESKLREATARDETKEISQQKAQDYNEREDNLIISSRPPDDYPSGILSIQVHQITGLELEQIKKDRPKGGGEDESDPEEEDSDDLPSAYCMIILNHSKIYRTRTKPKNAKPYFNAGTERYIRDWRTSELIITVKDSRVHENDPLLGIVYLPLAKIFKDRSQMMDSFPLAGGIGYGRARVSLVFRSTKLQLSQELLGWEYGTLEIKSGIKPVDLSSDLRQLRLRLSNPAAHGKMHHTKDSEGWKPKRGRRSLCLAVKNRYSNALLIEFRKASLGPDSTPAWGVFWLKDIPDEEEKTVRLPVWSNKVDMKRGKSCCDFDKKGQKPLGELELTLKFWRGLSGYHKASTNNKQADLQDIMEALDTVDEINSVDTNSDNDTSSYAAANDGSSDLSKSSSGTDTELPTPSSESDENDDSGPRDHPSTSTTSLRSSIKKTANRAINGNQDTSSEGSRGPLDEIRDYKKHRKQLHRRHRGLMQWKTVRSLDWAKTKVEHTKDGAVETFKHSERKPGIETEV